MRQSRPNYESLAPKCRTSRPKQSNSLNDEKENRIVMLYKSGQSIESITRQIGRARHLVVHVLQSRGVFANRQPRPECCKEPEPPIVKELEEAPILNEREVELLAVNEPAAEILATEKALTQSKISGKSRSVEKPVPHEKPGLTPQALEKEPNKSRWSAQVVDAMCKVGMQLDLYPEMSSEDVRKTIAKSNHVAGAGLTEVIAPTD